MASFYVRCRRHSSVTFCALFLVNYPVTFVVPVPRVGDEVRQNFLLSPCLNSAAGHQLLIQEAYSSAAEAYNDAIDRSVNDLMVFVHQDVVLPFTWMSQLRLALKELDVMDPNWGVLGCYGVRADASHVGYLYSPGVGILGTPFSSPTPVQTLDEVVLILRRSSGLRFDEGLPHFHLYGSDICLRAAKRGSLSYAIPAFCVHNANRYLVLPKEYYISCRHFRRIWRSMFPVHTTCLTFTNSNTPLYGRRLASCMLSIFAEKDSFLRGPVTFWA